MNKTKIRETISENLVLILFAIICVLEIAVAKQPAAWLMNEIVTRIFRNAILILSLLVPVWAGLGLNFSIVIGAMAAQIGLIIVKNFYIGGVGGLALAFVISIPFAVIFGFLTGKLFNRTKGQEMITGMILGFFAKGIYDLVFMFLCGPVIPIKNPELLLTNGIGLITPIVLDDKTTGAINNIMKMAPTTFFSIVLVVAVVWMAALAFMDWRKKGKAFSWKKQYGLFASIAIAAIYFILLFCYPRFRMMFILTKIPVATGFVILAVCLFITYFGRTKLGSDISAVGQNRDVAASMGINVDSIRIKATVVSTILASLGQLIFIQDIGNFATYNAHENVGTFAIAALLVGGASIRKANIKQVFLGAFLFHTMYAISPIAGRELFGDAQMGEYFRVFACYAVITVALVMHSVENSRK